MIGETWIETSQGRLYAKHWNFEGAGTPSECVALITESAQAFVERRTIEGILGAKQNFARAGQIERLQKYHGDKASWVLHAWIDTWLAPGFAKWNLDAALLCVQCPTLVIHGEDDKFGSPRHPEWIAASIRVPVEMKILPQCGHVPHRDLERTVLDLIYRFSKSLVVDV